MNEAKRKARYSGVITVEGRNDFEASRIGSLELPYLSSDCFDQQLSTSRYSAPYLVPLA
jgi:hypothetical protein